MLRINTFRALPILAAAAISITPFVAPAAPASAAEGTSTASTLSVFDPAFQGGVRVGASSSGHPGGANFLFADGSVRSVQYSSGLFVAAGDVDSDATTWGDGPVRGLSDSINR